MLLSGIYDTTARLCEHKQITHTHTHNICVLIHVNEARVWSDKCGPHIKMSHCGKNHSWDWPRIA